MKKRADCIHQITGLLAAGALLSSLASPALAFEAPPAAPGKTIAATGTIQVAFTPGDDADRLVIDAVNKAKRQILVQAFSFTHKKIAQALIAARRRGVEVQLIADAVQTEKIPTSVIADIAAGGVPVFLDADHESSHNKVMVIDAGSAEAMLITGSYNFTHAAQFKNAENLLVIKGNDTLAQAYLKNWQRHREHAQPYRKAGQ